MSQRKVPVFFYTSLLMGASVLISANYMTLIPRTASAITDSAVERREPAAPTPTGSVFTSAVGPASKNMPQNPQPLPKADPGAYASLPAGNERGDVKPPAPAKPDEEGDKSSEKVEKEEARSCSCTRRGRKLKCTGSSPAACRELGLRD